jgi:hypothetical protein
VGQWRLVQPRRSKTVPPELLAAIKAFEPPVPTREADRTMAAWLQTKAPTEERDVWVLMEGETVVAYHTSEDRTCVLPNWQEVTTTHAAFAARHRERPGAGRHIVVHLIKLALKTERDYVTLDPFDEDVARVWERYGFHPSRTPAQNDPSSSVARLYRSADHHALPPQARPTQP